MKAIVPRCGNCRFWVGIVEVDGELIGECHFFPPTYVHVSGAGNVPDIFPRVEEDDWCGQFQGRRLR